MSKSKNHRISLIFSFICTINDFFNSHVHSSVLITIEAIIIAFLTYYLIGRAMFIIYNGVSKLLKRN